MGYGACLTYMQRFILYHKAGFERFGFLIWCFIHLRKVKSFIVVDRVVVGMGFAPYL